MAEPMENGMLSPEFAPRPEKGREDGRTAERPAEDFSSQGAPEPSVTPASVPLNESPAAPSADPTVASIETILSEDIFEHYQAMPPDAQAKFQKKGEEAVSRLAVMVEGTVIKAKEVLLIVVGWLKLIPGVNKYFLEQESKIKTDKIMELHKRKHGE